MLGIYDGPDGIDVEFEDGRTIYLESPAADFFLSQLQLNPETSRNMTVHRERFQWLPSFESEDGIPDWKRLEYIGFYVQWKRLKAEELVLQALGKIRSYLQQSEIWQVRSGDILQTIGALSPDHFVDFDESKKLMIYLSAYQTEWSYSLGWALGLPEFGKPSHSFNSSLPLSQASEMF